MSLPEKVKAVVPVQKILEVENWWKKLSNENKKELESLYLEDSIDADKFVAIQLCGKFVEQEKVLDLNPFWINHFYEYIVNHELIIDETKVKGGMVCFSNKEAELAIKKGFLYKDFKCPDVNDKCLMKKLLSIEENKKSFQFYIKFKLLQENKNKEMVTY